MPHFYCANHIRYIVMPFLYLHVRTLHQIAWMPGFLLADNITFIDALGRSKSLPFAYHCHWNVRTRPMTSEFLLTFVFTRRIFNHSFKLSLTSFRERTKFAMSSFIFSMRQRDRLSKRRDGAMVLSLVVSSSCRSSCLCSSRHAAHVLNVTGHRTMC